MNEDDSKKISMAITLVHYERTGGRKRRKKFVRIIQMYRMD
jgi:hypothetical protein